MADYVQFIHFKNFYGLNKSELALANNYICRQLNTGGLKYPYYYGMYCFAKKCFIVLEWAEKNNLIPVTKLGEAICNNEIVNFLKDEEHKKCSCASVVYNAVF